MLVISTNADSEVMALRIAYEGVINEINDELVIEDLGKIKSLRNPKGIIIRYLGGARGIEDLLNDISSYCKEKNIVLITLSGEDKLDAEMESYSNAALADIAAFRDYFRFGGIDNLKNALRKLHSLCSNFDQKIALPKALKRIEIYKKPGKKKRPTVAVLFYRAQLIAGNTTYIDDLINCLETFGIDSLAIALYSLRDLDGARDLIGILDKYGVDLIISATWAGGYLDKDRLWSPPIISEKNVSVVQGVVSAMSRNTWEESSRGLSAFDVTTQVAMSEFDGRIGGPILAFKEEIDFDSLIKRPIIAYRTDPERLNRLCQLGKKLIDLKYIKNCDKKIAIILSAYPTKKSRIANAVGLDTPKSLLNILNMLKDDGYKIKDFPQDSEALIHLIVDGFNYGEKDVNLHDERYIAKYDVEKYLARYERYSQALREKIEEKWNAPPGDVLVDENGFLISGLDLGNVIVAVQPPRGFGINTAAIYHDPDLIPPHHYFAFYEFIKDEFKADAIIHLGKHGSLEWLPGKSVGLSRDCTPDAIIEAIPVIYPFIVNDPGEGLSAKRRIHAVVIDHMTPPLTKSGLYEDLINIEKLLDLYNDVSLMDPDKIPEVKKLLFDALVKAEFHRDLNIEDFKSDLDFDTLIPLIDGYLCEIKDAQIRSGLHVLGEIPESTQFKETVKAICSVDQGSVKSLYNAVENDLNETIESLDLKASTERERIVDELLDTLEADGYKYSRKETDLDKTLYFIANVLVERLKEIPRELISIKRALMNEFIEPGPSGAPSRGMAHVLPTGRNFYGIDPRTIPTALSYDLGKKLADQVIEKYINENSRYPKKVAMVVWGTSAIRTGGDDLAQALWLLGLRPVYDPNSQSVKKFEPIDLEELNRPRVDVMLKISGFFRDSFSYVIDLLDEAIKELSMLKEDPIFNPLVGSLEPRIFGPKPGAYGVGILNLLEAGNWSQDADLAEVYANWSAFAYGRFNGAFKKESFANNLKDVEIAIKNQDNREHDIFDSDDYMQEHGGLIASIRAYAKKNPAAYFSDTSNTATPITHDLAHEVNKVIRSRVLNPKWINAMKRHGYKGAFEIAASVDYIYGYDATARVVSDWVYEKLAQTFVKDEKMREFFKNSNPWALGSIAERLLEASERGLWENPDKGTLNYLQDAVLESEGYIEER
jgi:cobaltochelatase CobN